MTASSMPARVLLEKAKSLREQASRDAAEIASARRNLADLEAAHAKEIALADECERAAEMLEGEK